METIAPPEEMVELAMKYPVPWEISLDKWATMRWRMQKAIELDRQQIFASLTSNHSNNEKVYHY
jgi:hypothetical protein